LKRAVILFAHGSRDAQWRRPVERLARALGKKSRGPQVLTAYLEHTAPSLESRVDALCRRGYARLTIVPVFFGTGRHLKRDLAAKAAALRQRHKGLRLVVERAVGERPRVIAALAAALAAGVK
jgi:sirohydrochlorin cobaltochelatase